MEEQHLNGGLQYVPQIAVQYVYLDFDGELTSYNGELLTIDNVSVQESALTEERIAHIAAELNAKYASQNVIFVTQRPETAGYSTIFIGKTSAFDQYGNFTGLAETIDTNNRNKSDNAFVTLDSTAADTQIIATIAHETDHLLGTLNHGGEGLEAYAYCLRYDVSSGVTSTGNALYCDSMYVSSGGTANNTTVNSYGRLSVFSGGTANSTIVNPGGRMYISSGGTATEIIENGGYVYAHDYAEVTFVSNTITGLTLLSHASMTVHKNTIANHTTVNSGGFMYISSGGVANYTTVNYSGHMYIFPSGVVNHTTVNYSFMYISSGGTANNTTIKGTLKIGPGGVAKNATVYSDGKLYVSSSGDAYGVKLLQGGWLGGFSFAEDKHFESIIDGKAVITDNVYVVEDEMHVSSSGTVSNAAVNSYGSMYVFSGGTANSTTVNSYGCLYVSSGGTANSTTVNSYGCLYVSSGGTASIVFNPWRGNVYSSAGAVVEYLERDANIYYGGYGSGLISKADAVKELQITHGNSAIIYAGGTANSTTVNYYGSLCVSSGGTANSTTVNSWGYLYVSSGGTANSTTVNSYGSLYVSSGGTANRITVNYSGSLNISSGGMLHGALQITKGAIVSAYSGAKIDFTVSERTSSDGYLINDLSLISGLPTYSITISDDQASGTYKLAQGAENFAGTVSIGTNGNNYGMITVNGSDFVYNKTVYSLDKINGTLTLTISERDITPPDLNITGNPVTWTNKNVVLNASSNEEVSFEYSFDGTDWLFGSEVTVEENRTVYFKATDRVGNVAEQTVVVDKIDKIAPTKPTVRANITQSTNQDVTVTAEYSSDCVVREYSTDNRTWKTYLSGIVMKENGTVYFRGTDAAGNISDVTVYEVTNIDKVAPLKPIASANITALTNQDVTLTAVYSSDTVVKEYSLNNQTWQTYTAGVILSFNGTVYFRGTDAVGNISDVAVYEVNNIDKVAPEKTAVRANTTHPTNQDVSLTAEYSSDSVVKEYSFNNQTWQTYTKEIVLASNGTVYFRGTDAAGNISDVTVYEVTNIDKVAPLKPIASANITALTNQDVTLTAVYSSDSVVKEYSLNNQTWQTYTAGVILSSNGTVYFRGTDAAGNISDITVYEVTNIDKVAPVKPVVSVSILEWTDQNVFVSAAFASDSVKNEYAVNGGEWQIYSSAVEFAANGTISFRSTDAAGNTSSETCLINNIDKDLPVLEITGNTENWTTSVTLSALVNDETSGVKTIEYSFDNASWNSGASVTVTENGTVYFRVTDNAGNTSYSSATVDKIDRNAPVFKSIALSADDWTFDPVTVIPDIVDDNGFTVTYRIGDGAEQIYSGIPVIVNAPRYIYFKATDIFGNSSTQSVYVKAGYVPVFSGTTSAGLQVSRGVLDVFAGGRAENTVVSSGGTLLNSGVVSGLQASAGAIISGGGRFYLTSDTTIASGVLGQTKNQSRIGASTFSNFVAAHDWHVDQKLLLQKAVVTSGGSMTLYRGASATILENNGYTEVLSKANARSVTVFSGAELNVNGGIAAGVVVSQGGYEKLIHGGSGLRTSVYGSQTVVSGGIANSTTVFACGLQTVGTKGLAKSGFIIGGTQIVSGGSSYRDDFSGGVQSITEGGTALETSMTGGARQVVSRRGTAEKTEICYGFQYVYGVVRSTAITSGSQFIYSGGSAEVTAVSSGTQYVNSGGIVSQTSVTDGAQLLFSGASAVDNTINAGALQQISAFASACNTFVTSGGSCWIDFDGFSENVKIFDGGMITLSGTVKNLTLTQNALYDFTMETAVFQGNLDCYLKPAELEILNEILMFSELESLTLRVNATDFGQDQYDVFSTEYNDSLEYNFILVLDGGKTVSMRDDSHYWYNGECYSLEYSEEDWQYYLNKSTQEKTRILLSSANNIDILETQSSKVNWSRNSYQDYGEVIAVQETGTGKTVYLNTGVSVKGLLQNATAVDFVNGGSLQFGTNTFTIDMYSHDDAEAVVYGVHNASIVQRRLASLPALPQGVSMNISAAAVNGSACAAAFINDLTGMTFSGGIAGAMQVEAAGYAADARGIYAAGTTIVTEPVTGSAAISADAAGGDAYAIGISELEADDFDADWNISATSENGHAAAVGITAKSLGQWTAVSDLLVTATAEKTAQAYGFAASDHAGTPAVEEFSVSELFKGTMQVRASGYDAEAAGIESKLSLNCNMGAEITVAAQGRRNASALGINVLDSTYLAGSVEVAASGEQTARAVGVNDMGNSHVTGTISIEAVSESGNAFACGWLGRAASLSAELTVYAEGSNEVKAFAFTDYFDTASGGSLNTLDTNGTISVTAVSVNVNDPAMTPVYAIGGRIDESVAGSICVSAVSANAVQETHAKAVHAEAITVTGLIGASAATQAVAVAANSENTQLAMTVSGTLFAGNAALNGSNDELLALLASPMDDLDTLTAAKDRIKNEAYAVYAYDENDSVTLEKGAAVIGNMALAGGSNTVTISNGAYYYGDINAENGDLTVSFVLDSQKEERAIITGDLEDVSVLNVDVSKIKADGRYTLVSGFDNGFAPTSVQITHSGVSVTLTVGNMNFISAADSGRFRCFIENNELIFEAAGCQQSIIRDVTADGSGVSWSASPGDFTAELSRDGFRNVLSLQLENNAVSTYGMPSGTWQWQVQYTGENEVVAGNTFSAYASPGVSTYTAKEDGFTDLFMLTPDGVWAAGYAAQHSGMPEDWGGTGEVVLLDGKNRIADLFEGAADANVLVLTDEANGDALFVDDIYTALGSGARISRIDEIRAGDGDDIVDMTSQRFTYIGNGVKIYGGLGNDTIWANNGSNTLFGDAGNDRIVGGSGDDVIIGGAGDDSMHGGGGSDIFCFNAHCGNDSVEQLSDGRVTLYFEADTGYWDPEKLTYYFDAENSVSVTGVGNDRIDLFFGAAAELPEGCFDEAASEKIFEDKSKGMLA